MVKKKQNRVVVWLKQRRVWAAILSVVAAGSVALGQPWIAGVCTLIAGGLGLHSYVKPKK